MRVPLFSHKKYRTPNSPKAKVGEEESYLLAVTRYIHLNPIKIAACRRLTKAERVQRLEGYRWSSYPGYVAKRNSQEFVSATMYSGSTVRHLPRRGVVIGHTSMRASQKTTNPYWRRCEPAATPIGEASFIEGKPSSGWASCKRRRLKGTGPILHRCVVRPLCCQRLRVIGPCPV